MAITLDHLRRLAVNQSLFAPTALKRALQKFGFVQADPIRAPARAQDLILRHRVKNYRAGDLERHYAKLDVEEDFFINYGFVTRAVQALMHPRSKHCVGQGLPPWPASRKKRAQLVLDFVRARDFVHPREVDQHFSHGKVTNYWGGSSNATTRMLDAMHYQGMLRIVRRENGIRIYAAHQHALRPDDADICRKNLDALADIAIRIYAPLPARSLRSMLLRLRYATPQWEDKISDTIQRAKQRLQHTHVEGIDWYWPAEADVQNTASQDSVRLLAPFDPVVWDRFRFELLWGWSYRFEAYTPLAKRIRGYYALPLLWRDRVIGWSNLSVKNGELQSEFGYVQSEPRDRAFKRELEAESDRVRIFMGLT
jgi:uncharacterized protein